MTSFLRLFARHLALLAGALLALVLAGRVAQAAAVPAAEDHSAEFKVLELDLARFDGLLERYDDPVNKVTLFAYRNLMKSRAEELRKGFDQARYDELRYDINLHCQRLASWLAPLRTPPRVAPRTGRTEFSLARLEPSPGNPAEIKAALAAVDREVKRLDERAGRLDAGSAEQRVEIARIGRIKQRREELAKNFTKANWDAIIGDLNGR